jgi:hypothetical protein
MSPVVIGIDPHKASHMAAALDDREIAFTLVVERAALAARHLGGDRSDTAVPCDGVRTSARRRRRLARHPYLPCQRWVRRIGIPPVRVQAHGRRLAACMYLVFGSYISSHTAGLRTRELSCWPCCSARSRPQLRLAPPSGLHMAAVARSRWARASRGFVNPDRRWMRSAEDLQASTDALLRRGIHRDHAGR